MKMHSRQSFYGVHDISIRATTRSRSHWVRHLLAILPRLKLALKAELAAAKLRAWCVARPRQQGDRGNPACEAWPTRDETLSNSVRQIWSGRETGNIPNDNIAAGPRQSAQLKGPRHTFLGEHRRHRTHRTGKGGGYPVATLLASCR